jgi:hypothetical protein
MKAILKKIGYFIIIIFTLAVVKSLSKFAVKGFWSSQNKLSYDDSLKLYLSTFSIIEDSINQHPKMIDKITSIDSINCSISENTFTYFHTLIEYSKEDIDLETFNSIMKNYLDSMVRVDPAIAIPRRFNTKLYYSYYDKNAEFITKLEAVY